MSELAAPPVEEKDNVVSCVPEETADEGSENQPKLNSCPETAEGGQAAGENDKSEDWFENYRSQHRQFLS